MSRALSRDDLWPVRPGPPRRLRTDEPRTIARRPAAREARPTTQARHGRAVHARATTRAPQRPAHGAGPARARRCARATAAPQRVNSSGAARVPGRSRSGPRGRVRSPRQPLRARLERRFRSSWLAPFASSARAASAGPATHELPYNLRERSRPRPAPIMIARPLQCQRPPRAASTRLGSNRVRLAPRRAGRSTSPRTPSDEREQRLPNRRHPGSATPSPPAEDPRPRRRPSGVRLA